MPPRKKQKTAHRVERTFERWICTDEKDTIYSCITRAVKTDGLTKDTKAKAVSWNSAFGYPGNPAKARITVVVEWEKKE